ncbi:MAG: VanZ family protein [Clostridia bacterium]
MNKRTIVTIILWIIVIAVMIGIFCFSAQDATQSNQTSGGFARAVLGIFPFFKNMDAAAQTELVTSIMTVVRKCAHFTIYAFLGFWLLFLVRRYTNRKAVPITVAAAFLYAITDEIHQLFVPGRSGQFKDVCIDTAGAFTGALIALLIIIVWRKLSKFAESRK